MISKIKVKNNPLPKQTNFKWLNKITWAFVLLFTVFIWQCKKDNFTGETKGICPTVLSTDPANEEVDVFTNKHITVIFNEVMDSATINTSTFLLKEGANQVAGTISYYGDAATFSPMVNLKANTLYTGTITTGSQDPAGIALAENYNWTFKTGTFSDTLRPNVISTNPANGADDVVLNKIITARFNKTMNAATINASTFLVKQGSVTIAGTVSLKGAIATFTPKNALTANTVYNATITTGAKDEAGNALAENYDWDFETGTTTDATKPTVISTDPTNGATNVAVNKKITAVFSEAMNASAINNITFLLKDGDKSVAGVVSYSGTTGTFIPSAKLLANTKYTATITTGAKDGAGNALAVNYTWNFTTGSVADTVRPTVISTDPIDKATNVSTGKNITAVFSENMDPSTINASVFLLKQGTTTIKGIVSLSGKTATFNPSNDLMPNTLYSGTIKSAAKDLAGNTMAKDYNWSFTTGLAADTIRPTIIITDPINGATNVSTSKVISASFSENMDPLTINTNTFLLKQGTTNVNGKVSLTGKNAMFTPSSQLLPNITYTATITTGAKDLAGNSILKNYSWSFSTAKPSGPPTIDLSSAGDFAILAGAGITNTGLTIINGDVGTSPTGTITGFPPGIINGDTHAANPTADQAKKDLTAAFNDAMGRSTNAISLPGDLKGLTLTPGLYSNSTSVMLSSGSVTLDAKGDANAIFIFKMGSTLTAFSGTKVILSGGAQAKNIFWAVGTSATLGTNSIFYGNILADQSISLSTGAVLNGRALTRIAGVTLEANKVNKP